MACFIGITCGWEEEKTWHKLHDEYVCAVKEAGGVPFLLPSLASKELVAVYYNQLDGFIFSGGSDLDPHYFGEEPQEGLAEITPRRDAFEMALARLALAGEKPVLGICRGLQLLNVAAGGTLYQDLKGVTRQKHKQRAPRWYPTHRVQVQPDSELFKLVQQESFSVNSFHHQGIRELGQGFQAVAWSKDGLIEALESSAKGKKMIAVQWHPECTWGKDRISFSLFKNLVECAAGRGG
ncbi:MAG TPA: gamma-glutamyl-gamma-aminobutyrate hydrolase family protein [Clostridia bacterium]|nr:gamma-glutamyl-gamma-aminobutyrate hydrolase family protein [Clostridia bacterium]HHY06278.1 gamma-glutamyl-gamma-aminobutyrate hydrolase family protein [Clostridia bacterium]